MAGKVANIANACTVLRSNYERGKNLQFVRKPLSWALYETWKYFDSKEKERKP